MYYYGSVRDVEGTAFEFDTKTGDMVLRLGSNYTNFDKFRSKLEGGDLEISKKEYKKVSIYDGTYDRLQTHDPSPESNIAEYRNIGLEFSVSMRSNLKRHFKFWGEWDAYPITKWVPDPVNPKTMDRWGYEKENGQRVKDWDDIQVSKHTVRDRKWEDKVLRNGTVYF